MSTQIQPTPIVSDDKAKEIENIIETNYSQEDIDKAIEKLNREFADAPSSGLMGWICPVCGRGLSPYTSSCPCAINREITCGTGTTVSLGGTVVSHNTPAANIIENNSRCYKCAHESYCSRKNDYNHSCHNYIREPKDGGFYG